jgi:hypothetical protein
MKTTKFQWASLSVVFCRWRAINSLLYLFACDRRCFCCWSLQTSVQLFWRGMSDIACEGLKSAISVGLCSAPNSACNRSPLISPTSFIFLPATHRSTAVGVICWIMLMSRPLGFNELHHYQQSGDFFPFHLVTLKWSFEHWIEMILFVWGRSSQFNIVPVDTLLS